MLCHLDEPALETCVDPLCFRIAGWVWLEQEAPHFAAVEVVAGDSILGTTRALYDRPDVTRALRLPDGTRTGFELFGHRPEGCGSFELHIRVRFAGGSVTSSLVTRTVVTIRRDYRENDFGILLDSRTIALQRRPTIYNEGPSVFGGSGEVADLIRRYTGAPPNRIIDVGCGLGFYGRGLLADGYQWMGAEVDADDCAELTRQGLPHRHVDGRTLPFAADSFDTALCIEVLEHIDEPRAFLAEIKRVAPRQLIVSVPNCELLAYLRDYLAVPWHMLEPDHKNFFTRWSLSALLREFYSEVEVRFHTPHPLSSPEGSTLHYNLFAVASSPS